MAAATADRDEPFILGWFGLTESNLAPLGLFSLHCSPADGGAIGAEGTRVVSADADGSQLLVLWW